MQIHWFPGHMNKARKEIKQIMPRIDVVIEILDARCPDTSSSPLLSELRGDKPVLRLLSKSDLADPATTKAWVAALTDGKTQVEAIVNGQKNLRKQVVNWTKAMAPKRGNMIKPLRLLVVGIPNVGKSTLINTLAGKKIAKVGDEPAVTKGQQKVAISEGVFIHDTPGVTWPKPKSVESGFRLAAAGGIRDTAMAYADVAFFLVDYLQQAYPALLVKRYGVDIDGDADEVINRVGAKRGALTDGEVDITKASEAIVRDFRTARLGRISLEHPTKAVAFRFAPEPDSD